MLDTDTRIHSVEALAIDIPLARNFGGSTYAVLKRSTVITRLRTEGGLVSEVYNGDNREHGPEIVRLIRDVLAPCVGGLGIFEGEQIWERLFALTHASRDRKTLLEAIACIDCAVWDLAGKALGQSVWALLGGHRRQLPIISIGGYYMPGKTLVDIGAEMEAYRQAGMAGCKFKVGGLAPEEDARRVEAARRAAGPDFVIAVDANRGWSVVDAVRFARLVEPLDIRWFEEPCHWHDDAAMMARVRAATRIPITAGQSEITSHGVRRLVEAGAVDLVNFDASEGGGVTEWRRAAALCSVAGVQMAHHEEPQIARQLLAAVPHGTYVECFADPERDPVWQALWANRPAVKDGMIEVSAEPGFGLVLDEAMIRRYRVA
ncbi:MAG TPA: mandelate racemase/muconate lactonizing enzyme family protein [Methylomirabilota bacterium]|nr:mandelate racemase/muconate lactonizing enzyme family protein [Methylomirabilota bacterium]